MGLYRPVYLLDFPSPIARLTLLLSQSLFQRAPTQTSIYLTVCFFRSLLFFFLSLQMDFDKTSFSVDWFTPGDRYGPKRLSFPKSACISIDDLVSDSPVSAPMVLSS